MSDKISKPTDKDVFAIFESLIKDDSRKIHVSGEMIEQISEQLKITKPMLSNILSKPTPYFTIKKLKIPKSRKIDYMIKVHSLENKYMNLNIIGKYDRETVNLIINCENGYINAQKFCKENNKSIYDWFTNNNGIKIAAYLDKYHSSKIPIPKDKQTFDPKGRKIVSSISSILSVKEPIEFKGIYVNPELFIQISSWVDPMQSIECVHALQRFKLFKLKCTKTKYMFDSERYRYNKKINPIDEIINEHITTVEDEYDDKSDYESEVSISSSVKRKRKSTESSRKYYRKRAVKKMEIDDEPSDTEMKNNDEPSDTEMQNEDENNDQNNDQNNKSNKIIIEKSSDESSSSSSEDEDEEEEDKESKKGKYENSDDELVYLMDNAKINKNDRCSTPNDKPIIKPKRKPTSKSIIEYIGNSDEEEVDKLSKNVANLNIKETPKKTKPTKKPLFK